MAEFVVDGDHLVLRLSWREKLGGLRRYVGVELAAIQNVWTPSTSWMEMRGWRMTGLGLPGLIALGTRRHGKGYDFVAVYRQRPTVVVEIAGGDWKRIMASVAEGVDPIAVADQIAAAAGIARG